MLADHVALLAKSHQVRAHRDSRGNHVELFEGHSMKWFDLGILSACLDTYLAAALNKMGLHARG